ncbi:MAG: 3-dehydroquinate synthase [Chloroflexi bacterium]|nr:3-dehydroquinate synthase [Chloroflexota bacterium]
MTKQTDSNIYVTGFSGTGKTTVGRELARLLDWRFVDLDVEVAEASGKSVQQIFADEGEGRFRELESHALGQVSRAGNQVVSTGGGIVEDAANRAVMASTGFVVCLDATPEIILSRLQAQPRDEPGAARPMLDSDDPLERIRSLKSQRQVHYTTAHCTVDTNGLTPAQVAEKVLTAWNMRNNQSEADPEANKMTQDPDLASIVRTSQGDYPIWVGWGILDELGERVKRTLSPGAAYIISDERVSRHARRAQLALEAVGIPGHIFMMPPGEQHKTLETVQHVYTWLADRKAERGHMIVAVGGGVVGDLAGFVAATYLRGIPFAQVPTSLLAMMDAAIGGKVAVDLPQGKNLVGAFYQPKFVLSDVSTLQTLPQRELTSGWAEAIKHGLILDSDLLASFERDRDDILSLQREVTTDIIRRSVAVKAGIVSQDERETLGIRILLNYGHTLGHAIETAGGYGNFLHGEAVSIGMMGAAYIGNALGMMSDGEVERQRALLDSYGLPLTCGEINVQAVNDAMLSDKKTSGRAIRWVLLNGIGNATTRNDVPDELVQDSIRMLTAN